MDVTVLNVMRDSAVAVLALCTDNDEEYLFQITLSAVSDAICVWVLFLPYIVSAALIVY